MSSARPRKPEESADAHSARCMQLSMALRYANICGKMSIRGDTAQAEPGTGSRKLWTASRLGILRRGSRDSTVPRHLEAGRASGASASPAPARTSAWSTLRSILAGERYISREGRTAVFPTNPEPRKAEAGNAARNGQPTAHGQTRSARQAPPPRPGKMWRSRQGTARQPDTNPPCYRAGPRANHSLRGPRGLAGDCGPAERSSSRPCVGTAIQMLPFPPCLPTPQIPPHRLPFAPTCPPRLAPSPA